MISRRATLALLAALVAGCAAPASTPEAPTFALGAPAPAAPAPAAEPWQLLATASSPTGGVVTELENAPHQVFPQLADPPAGGTQLDFVPRKAGAPAPVGPLKVWYMDTIPFEITFKAGATFAVTDPDATDGMAAATLPAGVWDGAFGATSVQGGYMGVHDQAFFYRESVGNGGVKPVWRHVGRRTIPQPAAWRRGDYKLAFAPYGLATGFALRWKRTTLAPALPPLPPAIRALTGPNTVVPGETAALAAVVVDPNGEPPMLSWYAIGPNNEAAGLPSGLVAATWKAPAVYGAHRIGLVATDRHFRTVATPMLPIAVVAPAGDKATATGGGWIVADGRKVMVDLRARVRADNVAEGLFRTEDATGKPPLRVSGRLSALKVAKGVATTTGLLVDGRDLAIAATDGGEGAPDTLVVKIDGKTVLSGTLTGGDFKAFARP